MFASDDKLKQQCEKIYLFGPDHLEAKFSNKCPIFYDIEKPNMTPNSYPAMSFVLRLKSRISVMSEG